MGLASVLAVTALLGTLAMVLLATTFSSHGLVSRLENKTRCRHLAEAAVKRALVRLRRDQTFGTHSTATLTVTLPGDPEGAAGRLSFEGPMASTNNLSGAVAKSGYNGQAVPAGYCLLVGVGRCAGVESRVLTLVHGSQFPFVLASQGPVISTGATRIGTLSTMTGEDEDSEALMPGDLACNSPKGDSVQLGGKSWVGGDLRAVGGVVLSPEATVEGQTLSYGQSVELPSVPLRKYDPLVNGNPYQNLPVLMGNQKLTGEGRCSTDMTVQGHLELQGATLFVDGDLVVTGGISGSGLVVVMGNTSVGGGVRLESSHKAVLLSAGDVRLSGCGQQSSSFHGLVYTEGSFSAQHISLTGAFISRGADHSTLLDNVQLAYDPGVTQLTRAQLVELVPGSAADKECTEVNAGGPGKKTHLRLGAAVGSWQNQSSTIKTESESQLLFNLNDFLGESQPLEVVAWREEL